MPHDASQTQYSNIRIHTGVAFGLAISNIVNDLQWLLKVILAVAYFSKTITS